MPTGPFEILANILAFDILDTVLDFDILAIVQVIEKLGEVISSFFGFYLRFFV